MSEIIGTVNVFVRDQETALKFYVEKLGWELRRDDSMGPIRWIEVAPAGSQTTIVLADSAFPLFSEDKVGRYTELQIFTDDIQSLYPKLNKAGVDFPTPPEDQPWGWHSVFADPDGNEYFLVQPK
jgi:lactoylglutathione lyase